MLACRWRFALPAARCYLSCHLPLLGISTGSSDAAVQAGDQGVLCCCWLARPGASLAGWHQRLGLLLLLGRGASCLNLALLQVGGALEPLCIASTCHGAGRAGFRDGGALGCALLSAGGAWLLALRWRPAWACALWHCSHSLTGRWHAASTNLAVPCGNCPWLLAARRRPARRRRAQLCHGGLDCRLGQALRRADGALRLVACRQSWRLRWGGLRRCSVLQACVPSQSASHLVQAPRRTLEPSP